MTLHGDRVTCDVRDYGCAKSIPLGDWLRTKHKDDWICTAEGRDACPACRARYTDEQLRAMLAQPKETT